MCCHIHTLYLSWFLNLVIIVLYTMFCNFGDAYLAYPILSQCVHVDIYFYLLFFFFQNVASMETKISLNFMNCV